MPSESHFEPRSPRCGPFLVWGCARPSQAYFGDLGELFGTFLGHIVQLEGTKGVFDTRKAARAVYLPFPFI